MYTSTGGGGGVAAEGIELYFPDAGQKGGMLEGGYSKGLKEGELELVLRRMSPLKQRGQNCPLASWML